MQESTGRAESPVLRSLKGQLIVSCQAAKGDPFDDVAALTRMAQSVLRGGAGGLRAEGAANVGSFRAITNLPILGLIKRFDEAGEVYITPDFASAQVVADAGADIVALDCTHRRLCALEPWPVLIGRIHTQLNKIVCADIASLEDAMLAENSGADMVATTLCGYTSDTAKVRSVPWTLLDDLIRKVRIPVLVEGHVISPQEVRKALDRGAHAVVVGSAITRPESITARFVAAAGDHSDGLHVVV